MAELHATIQLAGGVVGKAVKGAPNELMLVQLGGRGVEQPACSISVSTCIVDTTITADLQDTTKPTRTLDELLALVERVSSWERDTAPSRVQCLRVC